MFGVKKANYNQHGLHESQFKHVVFNIVRVLTCLVPIFTLGYYVADWDIKLLYSEWMDAE